MNSLVARNFLPWACPTFMVLNNSPSTSVIINVSNPKVFFIQVSISRQLQHINPKGRCAGAEAPAQRFVQ
jgi:hypothetical protein